MRLEYKQAKSASEAPLAANKRRESIVMLELRFISDSHRKRRESRKQKLEKREVVPTASSKLGDCFGPMTP